MNKTELLNRLSDIEWDDFEVKEARSELPKNIWEYYNVLIQRLRNYSDNPFRMGDNGFAYEDDSQLDALREGLVNMLMHAD